MSYEIADLGAGDSHVLQRAVVEGLESRGVPPVLVDTENP